MKKTFALMIAVACLGLGSQTAIAGPDGAKVFKQRCAMCHAIDHKKYGPAVKGMGTDDAVLKDKITSSKHNGAMKAAVKKLSPDDLSAVIEFIKSKQS